MPAATMRSSISRLELAGPMVQTILVRLMRWRARRPASGAGTVPCRI
jgi:hypothetical protein